MGLGGDEVGLGRAGLGGRRLGLGWGRSGLGGLGREEYGWRCDEVGERRVTGGCGPGCVCGE